MGSVDKLIDAGLKHVDQTYDVNLSLAKFRMSGGNEKEEESKQFEQLYASSLI